MLFTGQSEATVLDYINVRINRVICRQSVVQGRMLNKDIRGTGMESAAKQA